MKLKKSVYLSLAISGLMLGNVSYANSNEYETYTKPMPKSHSISNYMSEMPTEVKQDIEELNNFKYLKTKTNSNYEVALASQDGKYIFYKEANTYDEAVNIAKNIQNEYSYENIVPSVINKEGLIVYSTNSIGRIVKLGDGISESSINYTAKLYKNANDTNEYTYINHGYIEDVPVIEETETMAKIEVAGFSGWIKKQDDKGTNIVVLPINQAKNLSYYKNVNGRLSHYISSNVQGNTGTYRTIGQAPSFMKNEVKYYSYDGNYFYDDINKLISDAKENNHNNAVNTNEPYYNYYQYLPGRSKSSYDANDINEYFKAKTPSDSVLRNTGKYFIKAQNKYGVNASVMVGIAMNESAKGTSTLAKQKNNIFGINAKDSNPNNANYFKSIENCINEFAKEWMSNEYLNPNSWKYNGNNLGNKEIGCNVRYASDPYWSEKASSYMNEMDVELSSRGLGDDYNRYKIGMLNKSSNINDKSGNRLYTSDKGEVVLISDDRNSNIEINPDRITPSNVANPIPGSYDYTFKGYVNKNDVNIINNQKDKVILDTIIGNDRYETAAMISDNQNYTSAILVNGDKTLADGLSASGLSGITKSPILLTKVDSIPNETKERLNGVNKVYLIGGKSVISPKIESDLKSQGKEVIRLSGNSREETSYKVADEIKKINPNIDKVFLVNGYKGEPDAMSVSPIASRDGVPIILTNGKDIPFNTNNKSTYVIGSSISMSDNIVNKTNATRLGGSDRFATNKLVIEKFYPNTNEFYISKGYTLVDALTVSPLAKNYPVVLVHNNSDKSVIKNATKLIQVGGIDKSIVNECINVIK
ncbi:cell wall-binding repeat-containing protein [Romboutsia hominis]|uniref:Cell wall binding repeat protein/mannosyl-glycoprotein endo-beta-N-acetylglucosamidase domain n=1 Tax=Romboutsia hominis TaxID=1507512 RepID=A0A2P2BSJ0_9FIRM|nr:cell wall-binding repeat-containing protein [Romboutsia hominis]CEI73319.1 Cell wall binding repeat protein/mannosyl-glycoprotein endo-beta-N-acetylglucosamidase domain [Romboutsia hominis]